VSFSVKRRREIEGSSENEKGKKSSDVKGRKSKEKGEGGRSWRRRERGDRIKKKEKKKEKRDNLILGSVQIFCDRTLVVICVSIIISI
jgi:hypothetical protein